LHKRPAKTNDGDAANAQFFRQLRCRALNIPDVLSRSHRGWDLTLDSFTLVSITSSKGSIMGRDIPESLRRFSDPESKQAVQFWTRNARVIAVKIWSETHVSSSGGGGYIQGGTGYVNAPKVSSSVTEKREMWYQGEDGKQNSLKILPGVKVNEGNDISLVSIGTADSGWLVALVNRTTGLWYDGIVEGGFTSGKGLFKSKFFNSEAAPGGGLGCGGGCLTLIGVVCIVAWLVVTKTDCEVSVYLPYRQSCSDQAGLYGLGGACALVLGVVLIAAWKSAANRVSQRNNAKRPAIERFEDHYKRVIGSLF